MIAKLTRFCCRTVVCAAITASFVQNGLAAEAASSLDARQRAIVAISVHTAQGDMRALERNLTAGLQAGLTVNEIKEVLVQLYAYTGFPRSLNAINCFMRVMDAREKAGIKDPIGKEASPIPEGLDRDAYGAKVRAKLGGRTEIPPPSGYQVFAPAIDAFLKQHLFCDIFIRDNLDAQSRELATIGALGGMTGTQGQLVLHMNAAMNTGVSASQMQSYIDVLKTEVGEKQASSVGEVLEGVLQKRKAK